VLLLAALDPANADGRVFVNRVIPLHPGVMNLAEAVGVVTASAASNLTA
jgi:hypothetical protein